MSGGFYNTAEAWREKAVCRGRTELFFVDRGDHRRAAEAKALCNTCPVRSECLEYALATPPGDCETGIIGGTTPKERQAMRRQRRTAA